MPSDPPINKQATLNDSIQGQGHEKYSPTQLNLIKMAEESQISATSYGITVGAQPQNLKCFSVSNPNLRQGLDQKVYLSLFINNLRVIACADSGSDLTLMQESLFKSLVGNKRLEKTNVGSVKSYSNNEIRILGQITIQTKFNQYGQPIPLTIIVIKDIPGSVTPFLFGNDSFRSCLITLSYTGDINDPRPEMVAHKPTYTVIKTYYASPAEIMTCKTMFSIAPFATVTADIYLHPASPVTRQDEILIFSDTWENVHVFPSKSDLEYDHKSDCFVGSACLINLTNKILHGRRTMNWEIVRDYETHIINHSNKRH